MGPDPDNCVPFNSILVELRFWTPVEIVTGSE